jgi:hypothetical protein
VSDPWVLIGVPVAVTAALSGLGFWFLDWMVRDVERNRALDSFGDGRDWGRP